MVVCSLGCLNDDERDWASAVLLLCTGLSHGLAHCSQGEGSERLGLCAHLTEALSVNCMRVVTCCGCRSLPCPCVPVEGG